MAKNLLSVILLFLLVCFGVRGFAQGKINAPSKDCLGNFINFSYTAPSGLTVSSISWDFDDGGKSTNATPVHSYANTGTYTIVVQASFTNSTSLTDSVDITIYGIPKIAIFYDKNSDSCFSKNKVCYIDTSRPAAPGQSIRQKLIVWGDGSFNTISNPPYGQKLCHSYAVADKYSLRIDITDTFGCKNSVNKEINVIEDIDADFSLFAGFLNCTQSQVCVLNTSKGGLPGKEHYKWLVDTSKVDTMHYFGTQKCVYYDTSRTGKVTLITQGDNACVDTIVKTFSFIHDALPDSIEYSDDTLLCYAGDVPIKLEFKNVQRNTERWFFDNSFCGKCTGRIQASPYGPLAAPPANPGRHNVRVEIVRGNDICPLELNYTILGPLTTFRTFDGLQCLSNNEVFFIENCGAVRREDCIFKWTILDPWGNQCVANRINDINKYQNCNNSIDWFHKHKFKNKTQYEVRLWAKDTVSGCIDSGHTIVDLNYCSSMIYLDSVNVCRDKMFYEDNKGPEPYKWTIDSANQVWRNFPSAIDPNMKGIYDVGLRFRTIISPWVENFGDDSIRIHKDSFIYEDTVYKKDYLHLKNKKVDSMYFRLYGRCRPPLKVSMFFANGVFEAGDSINVSWGGGDSADYAMRFTTKTKIDSLYQTYGSTGINTLVTVKIRNKYGCDTVFFLPLMAGKFVSKNNPKYICLKDSACFTPYIYEVKKLDFWTGNSTAGKVWWEFDETGVINKYQVCRKFKTGGAHAFSMYVQDSIGCLDTISDTVYVQDVRANVKASSKFLYCSELKQFFDSSTLYTSWADTIKRYTWQFGSGVFSSLQKNPLQSINTSLDKIPAAHAVESMNGCFDTFFFDIQVIGPKPYFMIRDTIGCGSLEAEFINLSKNCKQYIWQYGDSLQSFYQTSSKQNVKFLYKKPGRYYISLVGIDTVFNPFTNSFQPCVSTFPDKTFQKDTSRSVLVLPYYTTGISSIDTVCAGTPVKFSSNSEQEYDFDSWHMGDSSFITSTGSSFNYTFMKNGLYKVKLRPGFNTTIDNFCRDSAEKSILVMGVTADFDIDPSSVAPLFIFHNKSTSGSPIKWDFGQPGSGSSNFSSDNDPSHNYDKDTGTFDVCLIASLPMGCADTVCKTVFNDHTAEFGIGNVFTPSAVDGKNDQFDIQIENEKLYEVFIYDRWGKLVFEGNEDADNTQNKNWNGKLMNKGPECPAGTYYYIFRYSLKQKPDDIITLHGVITLIR